MEEVITINSPWFWNEKILPTIVKAYQLLASDNIHDQRDGIMQLREAVGYAMRATDRPAGSHENRKLFVNDFAANYSPRTGDWGTITLQFRHTGLAIPIPKSLLHKEFKSFDIMREAREFRNKAFLTTAVGAVMIQVIGYDFMLTKGQMTTELATQYVAMLMSSRGESKLSVDNLDLANALLKGLFNGKYKVAEEALKTVFDVTIEDGIREEKLLEVNEMLSEFSLRLVFSHKKFKTPEKAPEQIKLWLESTKKFVRGEVQDEILNK